MKIFLFADKPGNHRSRSCPQPLIKLLLVALLALAGCANYTEEGSRTVGEFTDDVVIQTAVKTALIRDKEISGLHIDVKVNRSVVYLHGRIPTEHARQQALDIAADVRGVAKVEDRLTLVTE